MRIDDMNTNIRIIRSGCPLIFLLNQQDKEIAETTFFISENFSEGVMIKAGIKIIANKEQTREFFNKSELAFLKIRTPDRAIDKEYPINIFNELVIIEDEIKEFGEFASAKIFLESDYKVFMKINYLELGVI